MESSHYHEIEDKDGNLVDVVAFCSDWCHWDWCDRNGATYGGWNGCHEHDWDEVCASCGHVMAGLMSEVSA